jgi:hypothetical protein
MKNNYNPQKAKNQVKISYLIYYIDIKETNLAEEVDLTQYSSPKSAKTRQKFQFNLNKNNENENNEKNNEIIALDSYDQEITLDREHKSDGVVVKKLTAGTTKITVKEHKFAFADIDIKEMNFEWSIKLTNYKEGWLAVGVCDRSLVISNNYKFALDSTKDSHGTFLLSSNAYTWNHNNKMENNVKLPVDTPHFQENLEIFIKYSYENQTLTFSYNNFSITLSDVKSIIGDLTPCVVFLKNNTSVTFNFKTDSEEINE